MLCPTCFTKLAQTPAGYTCPANHHFQEKNGILPLLNPTFQQELTDFCAILQKDRAHHNKRLLDPTIYPQLPYLAAPPAGTKAEWRMRQYDLEIIKQHLPTQPHTILDIGAWNGWLSHHLTQWGHTVTALDYFDDPYDGLQAKQHYPLDWQAIQLDLTDLTPLNQQYHTIILNRCLAFMPDPAGYIHHVQQFLVPAGQLIATGLAIFHNPSQKQQQVTAYRQAYQQKHSRDIFLKPTKGYLDPTDKTTLQATHLTLHPYPQLRLANLKSHLRPTAPRYYYGLIQTA